MNEIQNSEQSNPEEHGLLSEPFFRRTDWLSFCLTTALVLAAYLFTVAPEVTLEMSGILSTSAKYAGVAHPPGFPVWTIYAWLFSKLLPFSNIAWRVAVSSAVAGALACGVISLIVSRGGMAILEGMPRSRRLNANEEHWLRIVCGAVAGMAFGFSGVFWGMAVVVDTRALSILLFSIVLCLLVRWSHTPARIHYLYAAFLVYGLTVSASQVFIPAALALPIFVSVREPEIGRELCFAAAILAGAVLLAHHFGYFEMLDTAGVPNQVWRIYLSIGVMMAAMFGAMGIWTRSFFTRCKQAIIAGMLCLVGTLPHLYLPLSSMTNPPTNWGYPRTVEGLFHVLYRGQFERINPTNNLGLFVGQIFGYVQNAGHRFGWIELLVASVAFCFVPKMASRERGMLLGLIAFFLCMSAFVLFLLNPPPDRAAWGLTELFFPASHVLLAIFTGFGLVILGTLINRRKVR